MRPQVIIKWFSFDLDLATKKKKKKRVDELMGLLCTYFLFITQQDIQIKKSQIKMFLKSSKFTCRNPGALLKRQFDDESS